MFMTLERKNERMRTRTRATTTTTKKTEAERRGLRRFLLKQRPSSAYGGEIPTARSTPEDLAPEYGVKASGAPALAAYIIQYP
jgi:hypothetical protein